VFRSGLEEAVYLCGAVALVVQLLIWSDGNNEALGVALIATAVLLVGWRLLNPLFTTLAAAGYSIAIALAGNRLLGGGLNTLEAGAACAMLGAAALAAGGRIWQRPAHDRMLDGLLITMPWLAHGWLMAHGWGESRSTIAATLVLALVFFVANLLAGLRRRQQAPLIGALGNLACAAFAVHELLAWPLHWELIIGGALLLAVAFPLERLLRNAGPDGLTSRAINASSALDMVQVAGAVGITPAAGSAPAPAVEGEGGGFGGGGASGRF
jgi:hypothetical protein